MKINIGILLLAFFSFNVPAAETTATGIPLDSEWRRAVFAFAQKEVQHCAWGLAHAERNFQNTLDLAEREKVAVDRDVLFAAAFLHDVGGIAPHEKEGVDHAVRSVEIAEPLLKNAGFPMEHFDEVKEIILGHTYYTAAPKGIVAQLFRDADILDFLGVMGVARLLGVSQEIGGKPGEQLPAMAGLLNKFSNDMPKKLSSESAKRLALERVTEMRSFLTALGAYSFGGKAL